MTSKPTCYLCGKPATKLCDFRKWGLHHGEDAYGKKTKTELTSLNTCDKPMCAACAHHIEPDKDYCQEHSNELMLEHTRRSDVIYEALVKRLNEKEHRP